MTQKPLSDTLFTVVREMLPISELPPPPPPPLPRRRSRYSTPAPVEATCVATLTSPSLVRARFT